MDEQRTRVLRQSRPAARLTRDVAPGIHRLEHAGVNMYIVEDGDDVTLVDAGFTRTWNALAEALAVVGRSISNVRALVLTHAHFDHVGAARALSAEHGVPIWVHAADRELAAHPYQYRHERSRLPYPLAYPRSLPVLGRMLRAGALSSQGVEDTRRLPHEGTVDVPGSPRVVFCPGHTDGHCGLYFPDRDAVLVGDALVTFDPYKGQKGPQIVARAATADSKLALASLTPLAATGAGIVLPGHGDPWTGGIGSAVEGARSRGAT